MEKKIMNWVSNFAEMVDDMFLDKSYDNMEKKDYVIFNTENIDSAIDEMIDEESEECVLQEMKDTISNIKMDFDLITALADIEDIEYQIKELKIDFENKKENKKEELANKYFKGILDGIKDLYKKEGYSVYDGEFFPCEGKFKSLSAEQIAIVAPVEK